jgi:M6 family metalloprotease-like protein
LQPRFPRRTRLIRFLFLFVIMLAWAAQGAEDHPHYGRLPVMDRDWTKVGNLPDAPQRVEREQFRQGEYFRRWDAIHSMFGPQHLSRKSQEILAKRGLGRALLQEGLPPAKAFTGVDTLKVLLIRIGFETNRDSTLTTIDPSGDFVLTPPEDPDALLVDPPPHNKAYFESHLFGLSEYYNYQSGGRLFIQGRVLPAGENDSYKLSDVADYGPGANDFWSLESLERLVRDMIVKADEETMADGGANLSDFDDDNPFTYIIFVHAGSDWQSDINGDSPNDIPTFFVTLGEPQDLPASGGSLSECSIIPETTNQDDYPGSIAAAFYHEFGHALGLFDVYNTTTGLPQVGIWDLMDSGTNLPVVLGQVTTAGDTIYEVATGVLPPSLGVWNKWFLGWVEMDEIDNRSEDYRLPAVQVPRDQYSMWDAGSGDFDLSYPQAIKAGPSPREYFLLENRYVPFPDETSTYTPYNQFNFERDEATGVILYLAGERGGTWSNTGMYDFFLPAGGLLVWHVNNDRIAENLEFNTVNAYGDGIRLLEADGIQDIGVLDSYVLGWYGSWRDPFGEDNGYQNVYIDAFPSSRMYDRSWSGLALTDIRQNGFRSSSVMRFGASITPLIEGFPWEVAAVVSTEAAAAGGEAGPRAIDTMSGSPVTVGSEEILVFADSAPQDWTGGPFPASLFALTADGQARWPAPAGKPAGAFLELGSPLAGSPVLVPEYPGFEAALAWGTRSGRVGLSGLNSTAAPGGWSVQMADSLVYGPAVLNTDSGLRVVCFAAPDSLLLVEGDGTPIGSGISLAEETGLAGMSYQGVPRYSAAGGQARVVALLDGAFAVIDLTSGLPAVTTSLAYPRPVQGNLQSALAQVGDSDRLWLFDDEGSVGCWTIASDGYVAEAEPLEVAEALVHEPAVADLDGDGRLDLVLLTATKVLAFQAEGIPARGFPVRFYDLFPLDPDTRVAGPLVVADATGDGVNEVFFNTDGGHLVGLSATGRLLDHTPFLWGDTAGAGFAVGAVSSLTGKRTLYLLSEGGYTGEPMGRQFYNGRVAGYELLQAGSSDQTTSGWFGPAGGVARGGPEGELRHLGPGAPASAEEEMAYLYPNPLRDQLVTLRFFSGHGGQASFELYNLEGELVTRQTFAVPADLVVEQTVDCSMASSGVYFGRLVQPGASGTQIRTMTLAVER